MSKLRLMTIIGTRPEIVRLSEVIKLADRCFHHILVHTGQNYDYELSKIFFDDMELREPDYYLKSAGGNLGDTLGNIISASYEVMQKEHPDAVLILGDTNSALSAIPAKRLRIPIFHMEAGNRCFDQNVPEETNRKIVDHISDVNLPYTEHSRRFLLDEGLDRRFIFTTGSPMPEVISKNMHKIKSSKVLKKLELTPDRYFVASIHREENIDNQTNFLNIMQALNNIAEQYGYPIIYSTHPRSLKRITERGFIFHPLIRSMQPFGFFDYNCLQKNAFAVLSDSGTLSEESALVGFPGVLVRDSTERPEAIENGRVIIGGIRQLDIVQAVELARSLLADEQDINMPLDYRDNHVSQKVVKIIESYTKVVNTFVWRKN